MPVIRLTITPPGGSAVDYSAHFAYEGVQTTPTISQNFGRQGDTAKLTLVDEYTTGPFVIPVLSRIEWSDTTAGAVLFAGVVTDAQMIVTGPNRNEWVLQCTDYTWYADNAVVQGAYKNETVGGIITALTNSSGCGITAGPYVDPGPMISDYKTGFKALSKCWKELAKLAGGQVPFGWYVDENLNLHFSSAATAPDSGVEFTTDVTTQGAQGHFELDSQFLYEWDATTIHNRVVVQGGSTNVLAALDTQPTDTWQTDGTAKAWPLRFTPTGSMYMTVGDIPVTIQMVSAGTAGAPDGWAVQQNAASGWFLTAPSAPAGGQAIKLWYNYSQPLVMRNDNRASQNAFAGPNGGIYAEYISDSSMKTLSMAMARTKQELSEYAWPVERITFNSTEDFTGWVRAGQLISVTNSMIPNIGAGTVGLTAVPFLVVQNTVNFTKIGLRQLQLVAVRVMTGATGVVAPASYRVPGAFRNYTLTDVLTSMYSQTVDQLDTDAPTGGIGEAEEKFGVSDAMAGTVQVSEGWDETTWGAFAWS